MKTTLTMLVLGALLATPLAAAQDIFREPNTAYDTRDGYLPATSGNGEEYFDSYFMCVFGSFRPAEITQGNYECPGTSQLLLMWGFWTDVNGDDCIGSCGMFGLPGETAPVTRSLTTIGGPINNGYGVFQDNVDVAYFLANPTVDNVFVEEWLPIGKNTSPEDTGDVYEASAEAGLGAVFAQGLIAQDDTAVAWSTTHAPNVVPRATACIIPIARDSFKSAEGMFNHVDSLFFGRISREGGDGFGIKSPFDGNTEKNTGVELPWFGDEIEAAYNDSEEDNTPNEDSNGIQPTAERTLGLWPSDVYRDLERDGCKDGASFKDKPNGEESGYTIPMVIAGTNVLVEGGYYWFGGANFLNAPWGSAALGTLSNGARYWTHYGHRLGDADVAAPASGERNERFRDVDQVLSAKDTRNVLWYDHAFNWRDVDCEDDEVAQGVHHQEPAKTLLSALTHCQR